MRFILRADLLMVLLFLAACTVKSTPQPAPPPPGPAPTQAVKQYKLYLPQISQSGTPSAASGQAGYPAPAGAHMTAFHSSGQTFLTWEQNDSLQGEVYRIYRSGTPIDQGNLSKAQFLAQVSKNSAKVWAAQTVDYKTGKGVWAPRLVEHMILQNGDAELAAGTGALVWTLAPEDFGGATTGLGYYAVTITPPGGQEIFSSDYSIGPVQENIADPEPVEFTHSPGIKAGPGGHFYLQYIDLRHWNTTFHAPNAINDFYGLDPNNQDLPNELAYTYDYSIFEPTPDLCGGKVPDTLPVMIFLHGARGNRYGAPLDYIYPYCAYGVYPIDESETWYFGFARKHDYRKNTPVEAGDGIENFTEQRILRMVYDLMRKPPGPAVDPQRIYLFGHSMGGTGSLAFAERYPNVFAAIYSGQPVTYFQATPGVTESWPTLLAQRWGAQELNLPIAISAPNGWAAHLQKYNGVGVFDWENLRAAFDPAAKPNRSGDEMVPFSVDHGTRDEAVLFASQGQPLYPLLVASPRAWSGGITDTDHLWSVFGFPLPTMAKVKDVPFWGFNVIRDETVPGLSRLSSNDPNPPDQPTTYNQTILWSASWNAWDSPPVDKPGEWRISFCAIGADSVTKGNPKCGSGVEQTVDITPRRVQQFVITPGKAYDWENIHLSDGKVLANGTVIAGVNGLLTIPGVQVLPDGNRLRIRPHP
jgi:pimeloyl-ACP methyl ester carboxylesterase